MARIRTIKPEFPQSESMGRVSRDARLLFVMLWPICDDHGRTRAASRMLASTLFPYDDGEDGRVRTTGADVSRWLDELENEDCIRRYEVDGSQYLEVCNWTKHQKIDKPSKPQFPEPSWSPREGSRESREGSALEGKGKEGNGGEGSAADACPHEDIIAAYHEHLPMCPKVKTWTDQRQKHLRARWKEDGKRQSVDYWTRFFKHCAASEFLTGQTEPRDGNGDPFLASLDWLVKPENFAKVIEGKYHKRAAA